MTDIAKKVGAINGSPKPPTKARGKAPVEKVRPKSSKYPDKTAAEVRVDRGLPPEVPAVRETAGGKRTAADIRILRDMVRDCIVRGITVTQACEELAIGVDEFNKHAKFVIEDLIKFYHDNTAIQVYAHYVLEQRGCLRELQLLIDNFKHSNQQTALVGAIKAKSEILTKVLDKGQDMGIIDRKAKRIEFIGSLDVRNMSEIEIARSIMTTIQEIDELVNKGVVIDVEAEKSGAIVKRQKVA